MSIFSIDESGYTGYDLLQKSQPWQGACAVKITHDDASYLIKKHFPKLQASELKFSSLRRRETNQKPLFSLQQEILSNFECVTCIADKRFALIQMFIEYAVEPFYYDIGENLYENGMNVSLASMAYYLGEYFFGREFDNILRAFQNAMHNKSSESVGLLINSIHSVDWKKMPEVLGPLALEHPDCIDSIINSDTSTDAAFMILQALITRTELISKESYSIEHDRSDNLLRYNEYLSMLIDCKIPASFKFSEIASIHFPLKLEKVVQIDSKLSPSVQLCDVLVGGALSGVRQLTQDKSFSFYSPLKLYRDDQIIHFLPDPNPASQAKFREGAQGGEFVDFMATQFSRAKR